VLFEVKPKLYIIFLLTFVLDGCSSTSSGIELSTLIINGKKQNKLIQDRNPDYGIDSRDGCVVMGEISLSLETFAQDSIKGTTRESENEEALPFATVRLRADKQEDLTLHTDSTGNFRTRIPAGLQEIQIVYIGFRTLTADLTDLKE